MQEVFTIIGIAATLGTIGYGVWYLTHRNKKPRSGGSSGESSSPKRTR